MHLKKSGEKRVVLIGIFMFAAVVFMILSPGTIGAHSPSEVKLDYDKSTQTLKAAITHTRFSDSHYINKVEIRKNGNLISLQEYKNQPSETFTYSYKVTAVAGDALEVKAYCNKFGSKAETLTVGQPGKPVSK
jgi:desulfoferrodoxin (superoxide reductase-like protein)